MRLKESVIGTLFLIAGFFYGVTGVFAQAENAPPDAFYHVLIQAAESGATQTVAALVRERRLEVRPIVDELIRLSMRAALRGDEAEADRKREAAGSIADAFAGEFSERSLQRAVEYASIWSHDEMARKLRADSLYSEGTALRGHGGTRDRAYGLYLEVLADYRALGDQLGEGAVLGGLGVVWWYAGDPDSTRFYFQQALAARQSADDRQLVGNSYNDLGSVSHHFFEEYSAALDYFLKAESIRQEIGDDVGLGKTLVNTGNTYGMLGDRDRALAYFERAAEINGSVGNMDLAAAAWTNAGVVLKDRGQYTEALGRLEKALLISETSGNVSRMTAALNWIGVVYRWLGDYESSLANYKEVIRLAEEAGDEPALGHALTNTGVVYLSAERPDRAADYFGRALDIFAAAGDARGVLAARLNLASCLFEQGAYAEGEPHLHDALAESRALQDRVVEARTLNLLGNLFGRTDRLDEAVRRHKESLAIGIELGIPDVKWIANMGLADDYDRLGEHRMAVLHYESAFETLEGLRESLHTEEEKANFLAQQRYAFEEVVTSMARLHESAPDEGYDQLAFKYAEQAKARAFLDLLAEALSHVREGIDTELRNRQETLLTDRSRVQQELQALTGAADDSVRTELRQAAAGLDDAYRALQREMYRQNPRYSALQYPSPVTLDEIQHDLLAGDDVLLEYALGDTSTTLWVVTGVERALYRLPGRAEIEEQVELLRHALANPLQGNPSRFATTAHRLYELLLQPAESYLAEGRRLIIVPDGPLLYLPFEALVTAPGDEASTYAELSYLVRRHAVTYGPSASVLKQLREERRDEAPSTRKELLAFGDPVFGSDEYPAGAGLERLAYSGTEVEGIARLFAPGDADVFVRGDASEAHAKEAGSYRYVHFATHGLIDERRPDFSSVVLARSEGEDGLLQAAEIFNLRLNADLVVLSACQTGLGKMVRGEGMIGLTRAFMYAGAPSLVVSLWRVADLSTARLMERFYDQLVAQKSGKTEALRQAKLALLEDESLAHPFSWAPFILVGNWE